MECGICEKKRDQTVKVFVKGWDERQLCYACVVKLRTRKLYYCEGSEKYRFGVIRKKAKLLRGRQLGPPQNPG